MRQHEFFIAFLLAVTTSSVYGLYEGGSDVVSLTSSNFDKRVKNGDGLWIVEFYADWCGHCQQLAGEYSKAAKALKGVVSVGAVNADSDKSIMGEYNVQGFPTIKIFNGRKVEDYNGPRTAQGLIDAAMKAVKSKVEAQFGGKTSGGGGGGGGGSGEDAVVELTESNFEKLVMKSDEPILVEFFAPWCGHCKRLAPEWAKAAKELKGKMVLGAVDATVHQSLAGKYDIKGYPTIKFFPAGKKSSPVDYDGGRTAEDIINWGNEKSAASAPPPELNQIVKDDVLTEACGKVLCVVSVLPHILDCDAKCRNSYLDVLKTQGEKFKQHQWGWVWAQAGDYLTLEEALDMGGFGYPALAIVNVKKGKYSLFRGSFSNEGLGEFLRDLSYGKGSTAPLKGASLPKLSPTEPWDGKDGQLPVEEDFDVDEKDEL